MNYDHYIPQSPELKSTVSLFWQIDQRTEFQNEIILPTGFIEVIFNFSSYETIQSKMGERIYPLPKCFINGYNTSPVRLWLPEQLTFFGVHFQPAAIKDIFGVPAGEFINQCIDLTLVDKSIDSLWQRIGEQATFNNRVTIFSQWLQDRSSSLTKQEQLLNHFLSDRGVKTFSVAELSNLMCYSSRHLSRKLQTHTGMNTEETLLYKKYLQSASLIHFSELSLTEIAYNSGFADQSHLIKTFKSFTGITPGEYKAIRGPIPWHIYEDVR